MLLAAGRGVRMGELTADRPKPLLSLGAETLVERQLRGLRRAGIRDVVMNV
ncbi:MAG: NTP transferase domain-containing protein, partial [Gammaproteobacteria bacterium]